MLEPVAVARGRVSWSNNGVTAFRGGLIGALGSGNSADKFPFVMLPPDRLPTDVAVTNNSELALVTVWNTTSCTSELAVLALTSRDERLAALPNEGFFTSMKLLGTIELPVARPTRVSASIDFSMWMHNSSEDAHAELATQSGRDSWAASSDPQRTAGTAGYALIASRDEDKVVVVDLRPTLEYLREMYFTTEENYRITQNIGPADDQWPRTFAVAPEARPTVHSILEVSRPSALAAGYDVGDRAFGDADFGWKAYIAREDGELEVWDMGALIEEGRGAEPARIKTLQSCLNPTRIARRGDDRDSLAIACRGERAVLIVERAGESIRRLEDSRFSDVIDVTMSDSRGANILTVADFAGARILSYLTDPIDAWGDELFGGLGPDGDDEFEFTGALETGGSPFGLSVGMVP